MERSEHTALQQQQQCTTQALDRASARLTTLDDSIDRITEVLAYPEKYFRVNPVSMHLGPMNIKHDEKSPAPGNDLPLSEYLLGEEIRRILLIIRFPGDELVARERLFQDQAPS
jgi:hypothetical protein